MFQTDATNLPRLMNCNGSRLLGINTVPNNAIYNNPVRDEGNAAHWLANESWTSGVYPSDFNNVKAPNGVFITDEIAEHVHDYLSCIDNSPDIINAMEIETNFGNEDFQVNGRCDNIGVLGTSLFINDFKYGWGIVEPERNWTLIAHAIGYCLKNNIAPEQIIFKIHQPRPHHPDGKVRSWVIDYNQLMEFYNEISTTLSNMNDNLNTGPWCKKCPSLITCPAARLSGMNAIDASEIAHDDDIDNDTLSFLLDNLKRAVNSLNIKIEAYEELAKHNIINGEIVPNYSVDRGFGNTTWKKGITSDLMLVLSGKDIRSGKMITPNQAKKLGVNEDAVDSLTYRPETGLKLKRVDADKKAQRIFNK